MEQENKYLKITVTAKKINIEKDGKKLSFYSYEAYTKKNERAKIKFTQDVKNAPEKDGTFILTVEKKYLNKDAKARYLTYWIKKLESYEEYEFKGLEEVKDEDLPF